MVAVHTQNVFFQFPHRCVLVGAHWNGTLEFLVSEMCAQVNGKTARCWKYFTAKFTASFYVAYMKKTSILSCGFINSVTHLAFQPSSDVVPSAALGYCSPWIAQRKFRIEKPASLESTDVSYASAMRSDGKILLNRGYKCVPSADSLWYLEIISLPTECLRVDRTNDGNSHARLTSVNNNMSPE